jgi:flavin-binding protein dodecin
MNRGGGFLPNVKTSDVIASSPDGWEDAVRIAIERANKTLAGLQDVEITRLTAKVEDGRIAEYRVHLKIHFILDSDYPIHE